MQNKTFQWKITHPNPGSVRGFPIAVEELLSQVFIWALTETFACQKDIVFIIIYVSAML